MTDGVDRTACTTGNSFVTHGKLIYFAHAVAAAQRGRWRCMRSHERSHEVLSSRGRLSRERVQQVVWWSREAGECLRFL